MIQPHNGVRASALQSVKWRKSRYSNPSGNCVELAELSAGGVAVRNSRFPDGPALVFTAAEWDAFLRGARDGDFGPAEVTEPVNDAGYLPQRGVLPFDGP